MHSFRPVVFQSVIHQLTKLIIHLLGKRHRAKENGDDRSTQILARLFISIPQRVQALLTPSQHPDKCNLQEQVSTHAASHERIISIRWRVNRLLIPSDDPHE